jgi:eukaryotic-like serine/threonine-protein kinase
MSITQPVIGFLLVSIVLSLVACQPAATAIPSVAATAVSENTSVATEVPVARSGYQIHWSFQTDGAIWGAPSVSKGAVYVGSDDGNLYAVDAQNGSLRWIFPTQGIIRSRPSLAGQLVYISSDDGHLYAIDADRGAMVWRADIGNLLPRAAREKLGTDTAPTGWDDMQSSPVVGDDQVFVGSLDGKVYALDAATGGVRWTFQTGQKIRATPTVKAGIVYIGSWDGRTYALDVRTGALIWSTSLGGQVQTTALVTDDIVYAASRKASVVALNAQTGDLIYEFDYGKNMWVESSPVLQNGIVYIGSAGNKWIVGLEGRTGEVVTSFFSQTYFMSTPAVDGDILIIGGVAFRHEGEGGLFVFKLVDGSFADHSQPHWYLPVEDSLEKEGNWSGVMSSPVVKDHALYFGGLDGKLYAVDLES